VLVCFSSLFFFGTRRRRGAGEGAGEGGEDGEEGGKAKAANGVDEGVVDGGDRDDCWQRQANKTGAIATGPCCQEAHLCRFTPTASKAAKAKARKTKAADDEVGKAKERTKMISGSGGYRKGKTGICAL